MNRRRFTRHLATVGALSFGRAGGSGGAPVAPSLRVDGDRITRHLVELSAFGKSTNGANVLLQTILALDAAAWT